MSPTWRSDDGPPPVPTRFAGKIKAAIKGSLLVLVLVLGVVLTGLVRLVEAPLRGTARPWSGWITVGVCRIALRLLGLRVTTRGTPMRGTGAYVANHSSWLDIFVLNAGVPLFFVSKAEVAAWPGIGRLARLTGTVFVRRAAREADQQRVMLAERVRQGHRLLFFPEGTSTDGQRVLRFKPTLFAALTSDSLTGEAAVQPVTVAYQAPEGLDPRFHGWWGDMEFGPHMIQMLAAPSGGRVSVTWHDPLRVADFENRKNLSQAAEAAVRAAHPMGHVDA